MRRVNSLGDSNLHVPPPRQPFQAMRYVSAASHSPPVATSVIPASMQLHARPLPSPPMLTPASSIPLPKAPTNPALTIIRIDEYAETVRLAMKDIRRLLILCDAATRRADEKGFNVYIKELTTTYAKLVRFIQGNAVAKSSHSALSRHAFDASMDTSNSNQPLISEALDKFTSKFKVNQQIYMAMDSIGRGLAADRCCWSMRSSVFEAARNLVPTLKPSKLHLSFVKALRFLIEKKEFLANRRIELYILENSGNEIAFQALFGNPKEGLDTPQLQAVISVTSGKFAQLQLGNPNECLWAKDENQLGHVIRASRYRVYYLMSQQAMFKLMQLTNESSHVPDKLMWTLYYLQLYIQAFKNNCSICGAHMCDYLPPLCIADPEKGLFHHLQHCYKKKEEATDQNAKKT